MSKFFITGGAGFIGSNLCTQLLNENHAVTVYDNLSLGEKKFIEIHLNNPNFQFIQNDLLDLESLKKSIKDHDIVFHLAANSDISLGREVTDHDLKQGTLCTYNVLEAMRHCGLSKIIFASTSAIYGEAKTLPIKENYGPLLPISLYGASKLASEGLISAFCHNYKMQSWIYRFANVVGLNGTHGALFDFIKKLQRDSSTLEILGDGKQIKPYIYVDDCVDGMLFGLNNAEEEVNVYNLTSQGRTSAQEIADSAVQAMNLIDVTYFFTGGSRGWMGDVVKVDLCGEKMKQLGWQAQFNSAEAMSKAAKVLSKQLEVINS